MSTSSISRELVPSVGNAWIICRSTSYPGRVYYFNTFTGEAVWNLSEPEILKAKRRTQMLENRSDFRMDDCPEPLQSPQDDAGHGLLRKKKPKYQNYTPAKVYNKQVINNQFTKTFTPGQFPNYNASNAIQFNIPVTPTFNGMWNVTPQPIFVTPTPVHSLQPFINYNPVPVTNTSESLSNRFKNISNTSTPKQTKPKGFKRKFKTIFNNRQKNIFNQKFYNKKKNDLRLVLSSKRTSLSNIIDQTCNESGLGSVCGTRNANSSIKKSAAGDNIFNDDDMWLEENLQSQGKKNILDLTSLRRYLQMKNLDPWYIVADSNALLNNINFINILINSDAQCRLVVPHIVMKNIQNATNSRLRTQAHRAAYFISQQVDANLAFIVTDDENTKGNTDEKRCIIICCTKLMEDDYHVIILSDDIELNKLNADEIRVLTIRETKILLSKSQHENLKSNEPITNVTDSRNIKITIPNVDNPETNVVFSPRKPNEVAGELVSEAIQEPDTDTNEDKAIRKIDRSLSHEGPDEDRKRIKLHRRRTKSCMTNWDDHEKDVSIKNTRSDLVISRSDTHTPLQPHVKLSDENSSSNIIQDNSETNACKQSRSDELANREVAERDNVMFEVTNRAMEDYLCMKSDEWVSRFIQIMEEVLAQILQQEPRFILDAMPPPWTVYEATECVKRKFNFDCDVVDASRKLLNVLFELGGLRGKIKNDISPQKYMEMYSFGVYLVDALQGILSSSEDLQTAAESLSKLLNDIQNPHLDPCNHDSFVDLHADVDVMENDGKGDENGEENKSEKLESSINNDESQKSENEPNTLKEDKNSSDGMKQCNLRSHRTKLLPDKDEVTFIRHLDLESSFFSSLELKKKLLSSCDNGKGIFSKALQSKERDGVNNSLASPDINEQNDCNTNQPKIIRKFTTFTEYEEKLKEKQLPYDSWTHRNDDFEELDYESMEDGYYMDGEYNYNDGMYDSDGVPDGDDLETKGELPNNSEKVDFDLFVQKMQSNVKGAYHVVREFCNDSYEKLSSTPSDIAKNDINVLAEKTYLFIDNLCNTFNGILERETNDSEKKIQEIFKNIDLEGIAIPEKYTEDYRSFIKNCLVQANVLKESLMLILEASKIT